MLKSKIKYNHKEEDLFKAIPGCSPQGISMELARLIVVKPGEGPVTVSKVAELIESRLEDNPNLLTGISIATMEYLKHQRDMFFEILESHPGSKGPSVH